MEIMKCPLCQCPVRIVRREDGAADHYETITDFHNLPNPIPQDLSDYLQAMRKGKNTVAIVGSAWTSGPWAPWGEIEVWGMNKLHDVPWYEVDGVSRWFNIHDESTFTKEHWEWLKEDHSFPIYMCQKFDEIPNGIRYPLQEIQHDLLGDFYRGKEKVEKLFSSTMCYQIALALYEDEVDRIELFGLELLGESEYAHQREAMAFWLGQANGMGIEVWMPEECAILDEPLYAYEGR